MSMSQYVAHFVHFLIDTDHRMSYQLGREIFQSIYINLPNLRNRSNIHTFLLSLNRNQEIRTEVFRNDYISRSDTCRYLVQPFVFFTTLIDQGP